MEVQRAKPQETLRAGEEERVELTKRIGKYRKIIRLRMTEKRGYGRFGGDRRGDGNCYRAYMGGV